MPRVIHCCCGGHGSGGKIPSEIQEPKALSHASTAKLSMYVKLLIGICLFVNIAAILSHLTGGEIIVEDVGYIVIIIQSHLLL
jgi:hypothetical protein